MKQREFERIGNMLLPFLPGFRARGGLLLQAPLDHTVRGICFDESIDPRKFYTQILLQPLYVPSEDLIFNLGWRLGGASHRWEADAPDLVERLGNRLRQEALPFFKSASTPHDVARAVEALGKDRDPYARQAIAYSYARSGDSKNATRALDALLSLLDEKTPWQRTMADRARSVRSLIASDPSKLVAQMDDWARETARNLQIEEFV